MNLSKEIISFKRNFFLFFEGEQDNYNGNFKTRASGNYDNVLIWLAQLVTGDWVLAPNKPNSSSNIFIEQGHTITLTGNESCNNFNQYANNEGITKINTGVFTLSIFGTLRRYTGTAPGTTGTTAIGSTPWIIGTISLKGNTRTQQQTDFPNAGAQNFGYTANIDLNSGQEFLIVPPITTQASFVLGGTCNINSGILHMYNNQLRCINASGGTVSDGKVNINNGGTFLGEQDIAGTWFIVTEGASVPILTLTLNSGGNMILRSTFGNRIKASTITFNGNVILDFAGVQSLPVYDSPTPNYTNLFIQGSGVKSFSTNLTINGKFSFNGVATINKGAFTLTYGANCDLEYTASCTKGTELINLGSGSAIPKNLILPTGVNLNLGGGTVNIRGVLTGGGTVSNGTLNQNQP